VSVLTTSPWLRDVAMPAANNAFVVGANFFLARWNGARWTIDAPPVGTRTTRTLNGVWGSDPTNVWAVGTAATITRWDGARWSIVSDSIRPIVSQIDNYNAAWGTSAATWVVGDASILRCSSTTSCVQQSSGGALYSVWGTSATNIYAVGAGGRILHFDGTSWTPMTSPTSARLGRVAGSGPNDIWAASDTLLLHFDGSAWKRIVNRRVNFVGSGYVSAPYSQVGLWAASAREAYYGVDRTILRGGEFGWDESSLTPQISVSLLGIAGTSSGCALAIADPAYSPSIGAPILMRGVGSTGCLSSPLTPPASWP
jgi:hypothetical protein